MHMNTHPVYSTPFSFLRLTYFIAGPPAHVLILDTNPILWDWRLSVDRAPPSVLIAEMDHLIPPPTGTYLPGHTKIPAPRISLTDLNDDVLRAIFQTQRHTQGFSPHEEDTSAVHSPRFEILISHVCRKFRALAIKDPLLWESVRATPRSSEDELREYLTRSRAVPLIVFLDAPMGYPMDGKLDALISHVGRWKRFTSPNFSSFLFARLRDAEANQLEHIYIKDVGHLHPELNDVNHHAPQILAGGAKKLSSLILEGHALSFLRPPLNSLITFHLVQTPETPLTYELFCSFLTASPSLKHLYVFGDIIAADAGEWPPPTNPIHLPALRALGIRGRGGSVYCGILLRIKAPELKSLLLEDVFEHDLNPFWESPQMRAFPRVTTLKLDCAGDFTIETYERFLEAFPNVTNVTSALRTSRLFDLLGGSNRTSHSADNLLLPWQQLHTLTFHLYRDEADPVETMIQRRRTSCPLAMIRFPKGENPPLARVVKAMRKVQAEGVPVFEHLPDLYPCPGGSNDN